MANIYQLHNRKDIITNKHHSYKSKGTITSLTDDAAPNEFYTFQGLIFTEDQCIESLKITCTQGITCFNQEGIDADGNTFTKDLKIASNGSKVLWFGVQLPKDKATYDGNIELYDNDKLLTTFIISLNLCQDQLEDTGVSEGWRLSRLNWLNSTIAQEKTLTKPYTPVYTTANTVHLLGRSVELSPWGLPKQILSYYTADNTGIKDEAVSLLESPMTFTLSQEQESLSLYEAELSFTDKDDTQCSWVSSMKSHGFDYLLEGTLEFDGYMRTMVTITANENMSLTDMALNIPTQINPSALFMGLGHEGGATPEQFSWKWNDHHQNSFWLGSANIGLKCMLKEVDHIQPFINVYYNQRKLEKPSCWYNDNKGGVTLHTDDAKRLVSCYSGERTLAKGESISYVMEFMITPMKCIDTALQWRTRYHHPHEDSKTNANWIETTKERGCNYTNVHHGHDMHPFINYPFIEQEDLKTFIDKAHSQDVKVKVYYTLRELTNHINELWPFFSLDAEIFPPVSNNNLHSWIKSKSSILSNTFGNDVIPAWQHVFRHGKHKGDICASMLTEPKSRLNNFYIAGLQWLLDEMGIDGLYIDDVAYDRKTMQRVRRLMDQDPKNLVDFHSWNHMDRRAGYVNNALLYMELLPYMDHIWFGEGFKYSKSPDYWFTEVSGIPFGLMGQMLQNGGHPYRGMVYGMTTRLGWGDKDPDHIYSLWDEFQIQESQMYGYWHNKAPVTCDNDDLRVTSYVKEDSVLLAIGSWTKHSCPCDLHIDWDALGIEEENIIIEAPEIPSLQQHKTYKTLKDVTVPGNQGLLLIIRKGE